MTRPKLRGSLTAKQERFVAEYLKDLNGKQAAIRAGYKASRAEVTASELLRDRKVSEAVAAGKARQFEQADLSAVATLEEIRRLAFSDIGQVFDAQGRLKPLDELLPAVRACMASVKATKKHLSVGGDTHEDVVEVRLWDKLRALEMLAKHYALLTERVAHEGEIVYRWISD
jgi:phage terminase small subunit